MASPDRDSGLTTTTCDPLGSIWRGKFARSSKAKLLTGWARAIVAQDLLQVEAAACRLDPVDGLAVQQKADAIALTDEVRDEACRSAARRLERRLDAGADVSRDADVEDDHDVRHALVFVLVDEGPVVLRERAPVHAADVVAGNVGAAAEELDAGAGDARLDRADGGVRLSRTDPNGGQRLDPRQRRDERRAVEAVLLERQAEAGPDEDADRALHVHAAIRPQSVGCGHGLAAGKGPAERGLAGDEGGAVGNLVEHDSQRHGRTGVRHGEVHLNGVSLGDAAGRRRAPGLENGPLDHRVGHEKRGRIHEKRHAEEEKGRRSTVEAGDDERRPEQKSDGKPAITPHPRTPSEPSSSRERIGPRRPSTRDGSRTPDAGSSDGRGRKRRIA